MLRLLLTLVTLFSAANLSQAQNPGTGSILPSQRTLARFGLERMWWGYAVLNPSRDRVSHLSLDEDYLYVQATSGVITAFDAETGERRWAVQLGRPDQVSFEAVSNEELVLVAAGTTLFAVDKASGNIVWQLRLPGQPSTAPAVDTDNVYIGMLDGSVYAYELRRIRQLFREGRLPEWSADALRWRFQTAKEITSPPVPMGNLVAFASRDGSLYVVSANERELIFQFETDGPITAGLARRGETLYLASEDFAFYAINASTSLGTPKKGQSKTGEVIWESISGVPIRKSPKAIGPDLFVVPDRGGLHVLSAADGRERWWNPRLNALLAATTNLVFASDVQGNLVILGRDDGAVIGAVSLPRFTVRLHNDRTDRVYIATESGLVLALRQQGRRFPLFHMYPDRLPILPEFAPEEPVEAANASDAPAP